MRLRVRSLLVFVAVAAIGLLAWKQWRDWSARRFIELVFVKYHSDTAKDSEQSAPRQKNPALRKWLTDQAAWHRKQEARHRYNADHPWIEDKGSFTTLGPGPMPELGMMPEP